MIFLLKSYKFYGIITEYEPIFKETLHMNCCCGKKPTFKDKNIDITLLEPAFEMYSQVKGSLITVLQIAQDLFGYLPTDLLAYIASKMNLPTAKVMGVVTFYSQFKTNPVGKNLILICQGTACHVNGSAEIATAIEEWLGVKEGEITPDGLFTFENVACLGCCSLAPAIMIGDKTYGNLTRESVKKVLEDFKAGEVS